MSSVGQRREEVKERSATVGLWEQAVIGSGCVDYGSAIERRIRTLGSSYRQFVGTRYGGEDRSKQACLIPLKHLNRATNWVLLRRSGILSLINKVSIDPYLPLAVY